jgi:hypothetical protein
MNSLTTNILNWYDLYRPKYDVSYPQTTEHREKKVLREGKEETYKAGMTMAEYTPWLK